MAFPVSLLTAENYKLGIEQVELKIGRHLTHEQDRGRRLLLISDSVGLK